MFRLKSNQTMQGVRLKDESSSRLVRNLLAATSNNRDDAKHPTTVPYSIADHNRAIPKRPPSANPTSKRRTRSSSARRGGDIDAVAPDRSDKLSKEDLINEVMTLKKRLLVHEETISFLKSDNHRLEAESVKQHRRIEQLLNLSDGVKASTTGHNVRKEIEKSILVRQLKHQLALLRNLVADKDAELENIKRETRFTHVKELETERDELFAEIQRLLGVLDELKDELSRERQRREWNNKLAGETGDDLRRELARLASGYQSILTNISSRGTNVAAPSSSARPVSAGAVRSRTSLSAENLQAPGGPVRPRSAGTRKPEAVVEDAPRQQKPPVGVESEASDMAVNPDSGAFAWENLDTPLPPHHQQQQEAFKAQVLPEPSLNAGGFNTSDYEQGDANSSHKTPVEPNIDFQPIVTMPQQQPVFLPLPQVMITAMAPSPAVSLATHKYRVGDIVRAMYKNEGSFYPGKIATLLPDGTYHVVYDDSDEERGIPESRIELVKSSAPTPQPQGPPLPAPAFKAGDKVEAIYYSGTKWYAGEVKGSAYVEAKQGYVYDVVYEDGDREKQVLEANVRLRNQPAPAAAPAPAPAPAVPTAAAQPAKESPRAVPTVAPVAAGAAPAVAVETKTSPRAAPSTNETAAPAVVPSVAKPASPRAAYQKGDKVEARYGQQTMWYPGKIAAVVSSSSGFRYNILYEDGDKETGIDAEFIRPFVPAAPTPTAAKTGKFKAGDKVEGYFEEFKAWFPGVVHSVNGAGKYYIKYDDGDEEKEVPESRVRSKSVSLRKDRYLLDERVEVRYGGDAAWFPGKISQVNLTGGGKIVYSVLYDDGDSEDNVTGDLIRVLSTAELPVLNVAPAAADPPKNTDFRTQSPLSMAAPATSSASPVKTTGSAAVPSSADKSISKVLSTNLDNFLDGLSDEENDGVRSQANSRPTTVTSGDEYTDEFEA